MALEKVDHVAGLAAKATAAALSTKAAGFDRIGGQEDVAAAIELEGMAALPIDLVEQIDAAVHQSSHRRIGSGPVVAVGLGAHAARQRQRFPRVDEHDAPGPGAHRQLMGGRDTRHAGSRDHDLGGALNGQRDYGLRVSPTSVAALGSRSRSRQVAIIRSNCAAGMGSPGTTPRMRRTSSSKSHMNSRPVACFV